MILDGTRPARGAIALDAGQNAPPRGATHREIEKPHDEQATIPLGIATCFLRPVRYNGAKAQGRRAVGIYLDVVFALNGTVNYALLCAAARVCGAPARQRRLLAAAAVGAVYACLSFVPGAGFLAGAPWRLAALAAMLFIGFGRRLLLPGTVFLALSLAMGGLVLLLSSALGAKIWLLEGRAYYALGFPTLAMTAGAIYLGSWLLLQGTARNAGGIERATLCLGGGCTQLTVLRDSGNTLRDPFTGRPVPVVETQVLERLLGLRLGTDAVKAMQLLGESRPELRTRLIPYRAVGTQSALLLAVRCDSLRVGNTVHRQLYVAASPTGVSEHGQYEGLIGEGE